GKSIALEAQGRAEELDDPLLLSKTSSLLGAYYKVMAEYGKGVTLLNRAVELAEEGHDLRQKAKSLLFLSELLLYLGKVSEAQNYLKEALEIAKTHSLKRIFLEAACLQGLLAGKEKKESLALQAYQAAFTTASEVQGAEKEKIILQLYQSQTYCDLHNPREGLKLIPLLEKSIAQMNSQKLESEFLFIKGQLQIQSKQLPEGLAQLQAAFELSRKIGYQALLVDTLILLGQGYDYLGNSSLGTKFKDVARKILTTQANSLEPDERNQYILSKKRLSHVFQN
ncbi:MAG: hypothetical protein D6785_07205, partial [Planctomycetota bacterium]